MFFFFFSRGELCPLLYLREQLKLCKDRNISEEADDSHRKGWERPIVSLDLPVSESPLRALCVDTLAGRGRAG